MGGAGATPTAATGATVTRALTKGEALAAPSGRADDFRWPHDAVNVEVTVAEPTSSDTAAVDAGAKSAKPAQRSQRWMLTPLSAGRGLVSIAILGLTSVRASRSSGRMAGSSTLPPIIVRRLVLAGPTEDDLPLLRARLRKRKTDRAG
jgi:hypothetical protein